MHDEIPVFLKAGRKYVGVSNTCGNSFKNLRYFAIHHHLFITYVHNDKHVGTRCGWFEKPPTWGLYASFRELIWGFRGISYRPPSRRLKQTTSCANPHLTAPGIEYASPTGSILMFVCSLIVERTVPKKYLNLSLISLQPESQIWYAMPPVEVFLNF